MNRGRVKWSAKLKSRWQAGGSLILLSAKEARKLCPAQQINKMSKERLNKRTPEEISNNIEHTYTTIEYGTSKT